MEIFAVENSPDEKSRDRNSQTTKFLVVKILRRRKFSRLEIPVTKNIVNDHI